MSIPASVNTANPTQSPSSTSSPAAQIDTSNVDQAVNTIESKLDESGWFDEVTHDELKQINSTLEGLSRQETNDVLSQLSDDTLSHWFDEMNSGAVFGMGGLEAGEKTDLFNTLASNLEGDQLARVANHLDERSDIEAFGQTIADRASSDAKVDFIDHIANPNTDTLTDDAEHRPFTFGAAVTEYGDPHAIAVGSVLGSLGDNQGALTDAYGKLDDSQLDVVFSAATGKVSMATDNGKSASYNVFFEPEPLANILDAAATSHDPELKARVFEAGVRQIDEIRETDSMLMNPMADEDTRPIVDALAKVVRSDTTGVVDELENTDRYGKAMTTFNKELLTSGQEDVIGHIIADLQTDNGRNPDPVDFISQADIIDGDKHYGNAQNLGYYSGSVQAGIDGMTNDVEKQAGQIKNIAISILGGLGDHAKVPTGVITGLTFEVITQVTDGIAAEHQQMQDGFYELAFPRAPGSDRPYEGPAESYYDSASSRVIIANN